MRRMSKASSPDAYGHALLAQYEGGEPTAEFVEREDGAELL